MKRLVIFSTLILLITSCATRIDSTACIEHPTEIGGFWWGLWNGMTLAFSFVGSLFDSSITVYDINNNGNFYNFGFVVGTGSLASLIKSIKTFFKKY